MGATAVRVLLSSICEPKHAGRPLRRLHRIDENVAAEVAPVLAYLRDLERHFHTAVLLVHRARKSAEHEQRGPQECEKAVREIAGQEGIKRESGDDPRESGDDHYSKYLT